MKRELTNEEARQVLGVYLKAQSLIHSIDDLSDSVLFKREFKQRTNAYLKFIEGHINAVASNMDMKESQQYIDIVAELDKIVDEIVVIV